MHIEPNPDELRLSSKSTGSANDVTTVTISAVADEVWSIRWIYVSFSGPVTTNPAVALAIGGTTVWSATIHNGDGDDPRFFEFPDGGIQYPDDFEAAKNKAAVVTCAACGAGITSTVTVGYK